MILDDKELGRVFLPSADDLKKRRLRLWHESIHKSLWSRNLQSPRDCFAIQTVPARIGRPQSADFPVWDALHVKEHGNLGYIRCVGDERGDSSGAAADHRRARNCPVGTVQWKTPNLVKTLTNG